MHVSAGRSAEITARVTELMSADAAGNEGLLVLSTPSLVSLFERTAIEALAPVLEPGQGTVGSEVQLRHLAATPVGMSVTTRATVTEVDGRRVVLELEASDEREKIADGRHVRYVVNLDVFRARAADKSAAPD